MGLAAIAHSIGHRCQKQYTTKQAAAAAAAPAAAAVRTNKKLFSVERLCTRYIHRPNCFQSFIRFPVVVVAVAVVQNISNKCAEKPKAKVPNLSFRLVPRNDKRAALHAYTEWLCVLVRLCVVQRVHARVSVHDSMMIILGIQICKLYRAILLPCDAMCVIVHKFFFCEENIFLSSSSSFFFYFVKMLYKAWM